MPLRCLGSEQEGLLEDIKDPPEPASSRAEIQIFRPEIQTSRAEIQAGNPDLPAGNPDLPGGNPDLPGLRTSENQYFSSPDL